MSRHSALKKITLLCSIFLMTSCEEITKSIPIKVTKNQNENVRIFMRTNIPDITYQINDMPAFMAPKIHEVTVKRGDVKITASHKCYHSKQEFLPEHSFTDSAQVVFTFTMADRNNAQRKNPDCRVFF